MNYSLLLGNLFGAIILTKIARNPCLKKQVRVLIKQDKVLIETLFQLTTCRPPSSFKKETFSLFVQNNTQCSKTNEKTLISYFFFEICLYHSILYSTSVVNWELCKPDSERLTSDTVIPVGKGIQSKSSRGLGPSPRRGGRSGGRSCPRNRAFNRREKKKKKFLNSSKS